MSAATESRSTVVVVFEDLREADSAVGALRQAGFREDQIKVEEFRIIRSNSELGRIRMTVQADDRGEEAEAILRRHGDADVITPAPRATATETSGAAPGAAPDAPVLRRSEGGETILLRAEQLEARKQFVEIGEVRVRKEVVTEHQTIEVPVQREEIFIERHAPEGEHAPAPDFDFGPAEEIRIALRKEQVVVEKRPVVTEEVTVGKRVVQETEEVGGEVRKEEMRVERVGREEEVPTTVSRASAPETNGATAGEAPVLRRSEGGETILLRAEQLEARKQFVEIGEVRVRKEVVTEHQTIKVPVQREEIIIERHAATGAHSPESNIGPGEEILIPVRKEQVTVEKRPVVTEEVTVGKRVVQETARVGGEVRKEQVRVERIEHEGEGDVNTAAAQGTITAGDEEATIRHRAYLKWLEEGRPDGQDRRHYFEAAREGRA